MTSIPVSSHTVSIHGQDASQHEVAPGEIAVGVVIGRASEYFDFFVYGIASALVFPKVFFPFAEPLQATLYSFAIFALAFISRPLGTALFLRIQLLQLPRLKRAIAAQNWPEGGATLGGTRRLVGINLLLGLVVVALASARPLL